MADRHKFTISLSTEQVSALKAAVEAGEYSTTSEAVRDAIRDWQLKRELRPAEIEHLRNLWDQGKASGPTAPLDFAELKREARRHLGRAGKKKGDAR